MRPRERHGLNAAEVQGSVRPDQKDPRFGEARRLLHADRGFAAPGRDEQPLLARRRHVEPIAQAERVQPPARPRLGSARFVVRGDREHADAALGEIRELALEISELELADRTAQPAIEHDEREMLGLLRDEIEHAAAGKRDLQLGNGFARKQRDEISHGLFLGGR